MRRRQGPPRTPLPAPASSSIRPTSYDVALLAGVSQSAVSRCFNPGASISPITRKKVEHAARSLGYTPNAIARSLITKRSGLVGLIVTTATLRYSPQIVHDLSDALQKAGLMPMLVTLADDDALKPALQGLFTYRPEAILSLATVEPELIREAAERGAPVLLINRVAPSDAKAVSIRCDHASGILHLTQRLIAAGHRRLAFVAGPKAAPVSQERQAGFEQAMASGKLRPVAISHGDYTYESGRAVALALLQRHADIDALVCANDAMALGALDAACTDLGLVVPDRVSITGFDDLPEGQRPTRLLTTIRQPTEEMAAIAVAEVLRASREQPGAFTQHLIPGMPQVRRSARL